MGKFEDEVKKTQNEGAKKIGQYLLTRDDLKEKLDNPKKSLEECFLYCASQYLKNAYGVKGRTNLKVNGASDDDIYAHAIHYYDEDNIKVDWKVANNVKVKSKVVETKEVKKNVPKKQKKEKKDTVEGQLSLFDTI